MDAVWTAVYVIFKLFKFTNVRMFFHREDAPYEISFYGISSLAAWRNNTRAAAAGSIISFSLRRQ